MIHFQPHPTVALPATAAGWADPNAAGDLATLRASWGPDVHVRVHDSALHKCITDMPVHADNGIDFVPLHILEGLLGRALAPAPGVADVSLGHVVSPAKFGRVDTALASHGFAPGKVTMSEYVRSLDSFVLGTRTRP